MTESLLPVWISHLSLPLADPAAAEYATEAMRVEMARLWQADRAAGLDWRRTLDTMSINCAEREAPEVLGRRLATAIRARLVQEPLA